MSLDHSPAEIIAKYLTNNGLFSATTSADWALFISHLPEKPSRSAVLYDTAGTIDGRYMRDGEVQEHQGLNLQVRGMSSDNVLLEQKMKEAAEALAEVKNGNVTVDSTTYTISNVSRVSGMRSVGSLDSRRRNRWTTDFIVSIKPFYDAITLVDAFGGNILVDGDGNILVV